MFALAFSVFSFLFNSRVVFSAACGSTGNAAAVTITGVSIAQQAYQDCTSITSLIVHSTVTLIGNNYYSLI
jgi:hypothetical protein